MCPLCLKKLTDFSEFKKICFEVDAELRKFSSRNTFTNVKREGAAEYKLRSSAETKAGIRDAIEGNVQLARPVQVTEVYIPVQDCSLPGANSLSDLKEENGEHLIEGNYPLLYAPDVAETSSDALDPLATDDCSGADAYRSSTVKEDQISDGEEGHAHNDCTDGATDELMPPASGIQPHTSTASEGEELGADDTGAIVTNVDWKLVRTKREPSPGESDDSQVDCCYRSSPIPEKPTSEESNVFVRAQGIIVDELRSSLHCPSAHGRIIEEEESITQPAALTSMFAAKKEVMEEFTPSAQRLSPNRDTLELDPKCEDQPLSHHQSEIPSCFPVSITSANVQVMQKRRLRCATSPRAKKGRRNVKSRGSKGECFVEKESCRKRKAQSKGKKSLHCETKECSAWPMTDAKCEVNRGYQEEGGVSSHSEGYVCDSKGMSVKVKMACQSGSDCVKEQELYGEGKVCSNSKDFLHHETLEPSACPLEASDEVKPGGDFEFRNLSWEGEISAHGEGYICDHCGNKYLDLISLSMHVTNHVMMKASGLQGESPERAVRVSLKNVRRKMTRESDAALQRDEESSSKRRVRSEERRSFRCSDCGEEFNNKQKYTYHVSTAHSEKRYLCEICGQVFVSKRGFSKHAVIHSGLRPYMCNLCGKTYMRSDHLKGHLRSHSKDTRGKDTRGKDIPNTLDRPFTCTECGRGFTRKDGLRAHTKAVHLGVKNLKCGYCGKAFNQKSTLDGHVAALHTGERKFVCSVCGRGFYHGTHLKDHMLIHAGLKPFECGDCGKTFRRKGHLRLHTVLHTRN
ncbi:zinc finger protein 585B-like [Ischnura elegans]|uniref:zinc finger protein 585B-like n=1 Tax=Ischnura elegans TaxID=197161 RepID=UPI001ED8BE1A|nr:zinc finger protein 585B-like [Ischnura elegans]